MGGCVFVNVCLVCLSWSASPWVEVHLLPSQRERVGAGGWSLFDPPVAVPQLENISAHDLQQTLHTNANAPAHNSSEQLQLPVHTKEQARYGLLATRIRSVNQQAYTHAEHDRLDPRNMLCPNKQQVSAVRSPADAQTRCAPQHSSSGVTTLYNNKHTYSATCLPHSGRLLKLCWSKGCTASLLRLLRDEAAAADEPVAPAAMCPSSTDRPPYPAPGLPAPAPAPMPPAAAASNTPPGLPAPDLRFGICSVSRLKVRWRRWLMWCCSSGIDMPAS